MTPFIRNIFTNETALFNYSVYRRQLDERFYATAKKK